MLTIARLEFLQLLRNRSVLISGLIIPLAVCASLVWQHELFTKIGSVGYIAATAAFTITAFGLYTTAVSTLASRRQNLFLKRIRSTAASDTRIVAGLILPGVVLATVQITAILVVLTAVTSGPQNAALLAVAVVATILMMLALALATAGITNSPEHAQVTTLPISLGALVVSMWVGVTGTEELSILKRALPGGSATELIVDAWNGGTSLGTSLLLLLPTLAWVLVAVALAGVMFRWEPRR